MDREIVEGRAAAARAEAAAAGRERAATAGQVCGAARVKSASRQNSYVMHGVHNCMQRIQPQRWRIPRTGWLRTDVRACKVERRHG